VVIELGGGLEQVLVAGFTGLGNFAISGLQPFQRDQVLVFRPRRSKSGLPIILSNGLQKLTADLVILGDPNPKWKWSWALNTFSYKGFTLMQCLSTDIKENVFSNTVT